MCQSIIDIEDTTWSIHEENRMLGQFFTPPIIKKLCVDLVKPKLTQDGKIETIFDPAMGTCGFYEYPTIKQLRIPSKEKVEYKYLPVVKVEIAKIRYIKSAPKRKPPSIPIQLY